MKEIKGVILFQNYRRSLEGDPAGLDHLNRNATPMTKI